MILLINSLAIIAALVAAGYLARKTKYVYVPMVLFSLCIGFSALIVVHFVGYVVAWILYPLTRIRPVLVIKQNSLTPKNV